MVGFDFFISKFIGVHFYMVTDDFLDSFDGVMFPWLLMIFVTLY